MKYKTNESINGIKQNSLLKLLFLPVELRTEITLNMYK